MIFILYLDGKYEADQTTVGRLANFNMWNTEMSVRQLNTRTCGRRGNVVSWNKLKEMGKSKRTTEKFPGC